MGEVVKSNEQYHMFVWDMIDSRLCQDKDKYFVLLRTINILRALLESIEEETSLKIVHRIEKSGNTKLNPFSFFDTIGIIIEGDSLTTEEVEELFTRAKSIAQNKYDFHFAHDYYNNEEDRMPCMMNLATLHKRDKDDYAKKIKKAFN